MIPEGARKEVGLIYHLRVVSLIETYMIPTSLVIHIDQTPSKYAPVPSRTLEKQGAKDVPIVGVDYKQAITATFGITFWNHFLPMQLIYEGKTTKSIPEVTSPKSFSLSVNSTHYSNENESLKYK